eukprot:9407244-Alexandrium_andersonii.AAC.1
MSFRLSVDGLCLAAGRPLTYHDRRITLLGRVEPAPNSVTMHIAASVAFMRCAFTLGRFQSPHAAG